MLNRMKLVTRLILGFGSLLFMIVCMSVGMGWQMHELASDTRMVSSQIVPALMLDFKMSQALSAIRRWELRHEQSSQLSEMDRFEAEIAKEKTVLLDAITFYEKKVKEKDHDKDAQELEHIADVKRAIDAYLTTWDTATRDFSRKKLSSPEADQQLKIQMDVNLKHFLEAEKLIEVLLEDSKKLADEARQEAESTYTDAQRFLFTLVTLAFSLGIGAALIITRSIMREVGGEPFYAKQVVGEIAEGNLAVRIALRPGDTYSLLAAMNKMQQSLADVVSVVRGSTESIATSSSQIASGNSDLSQRTEEQASNLQQTAASMEQLAGTVKTSTETASEAARLASTAASAASHGGEMVSQVVATMSAISESSKKISDIIGVIDSIAFQTNILALNAAVEAARAGEQGRGFAVVASEVRTLAQRSAEAAKEIKGLIGASVEKVEAGVRQVHNAGASMGEIVNRVQRVNQMISELSNAANEQSSGIGQVNDAMTQLDQVTQQNAALVEESAAAAESLRQQAGRLAESVKIFKVETAVSGAF